MKKKALSFSLYLRGLAVVSFVCVGWHYIDLCHWVLTKFFASFDPTTERKVFYMPYFFNQMLDSNAICDENCKLNDFIPLLSGRVIVNGIPGRSPPNLDFNRFCNFEWQTRKIIQQKSFSFFCRQGLINHNLPL